MKRDEWEYENYKYEDERDNRIDEWEDL